jgi:drug/metabolite transporter (DMT)-like permease
LSSFSWTFGRRFALRIHDTPTSAANPTPARFLTPLDGLLLLMTLVWASNFTVVKLAFTQFPPHAFNAIRLLLASVLFLVAIALRRRPSAPTRAEAAQVTGTASPAPPESARPAAGGITPRDWAALAGLGLVGHLVYQASFMGGLARTTVANSSLIIGSTPVAIALATAALGHERVTRMHWAGVALSVFGIYLVAGQGFALGGPGMVGDLLMVVCVVCWTIYTVAARPLLSRLTPLVVTGYSMALGSVMYLPVGLPDLLTLDWGAISPGAWVALVYSATFALCVAYLIWYTAVQRIGNTRTAIYSNMVPVLALAMAVVWLGERVDIFKIAGAAAILSGVAVTRLAARREPTGPVET